MTQVSAECSDKPDVNSSFNNMKGTNGAAVLLNRGPANVTFNNSIVQCIARRRLRSLREQEGHPDAHAGRHHDPEHRVRGQRLGRLGHHLELHHLVQLQRRAAGHGWEPRGHHRSQQRWRRRHHHRGLQQQLRELERGQPPRRQRPQQHHQEPQRAQRRQGHVGPGPIQLRRDHGRLHLPDLELHARHLRPATWTAWTPSTPLPGRSTPAGMASPAADCTASGRRRRRLQ